MSDDHWPPIKVERFDGEVDGDYGRRRESIVKIITGFRLGRFEGEQAEFMERQLIELQDRTAADLAKRPGKQLCASEVVRPAFLNQRHGRSRTPDTAASARALNLKAS